MDLTLGRARADCAPADQIRDVLRRNHVEILDPRRHSKIIESEQQFTANAQSVIDHEAAIQVRIVNQAFPTHRRARLFEIHSHDDQEVRAQAILFRFELRAYSRAARGSWMEHGPMMTRSRSSSPLECYGWPAWFGK
jgi:hypothetical protein